MGYKTWVDYGYGCCVSEIKTVSVEHMTALLDHAPQYKGSILAWFAENGISKPTCEDYLEFDTTYMYGLATILAGVIQEVEGIEFLPCNDFDGNCYLIYPPSYPWNLTKAEISLTEEKIEELLRRYLSILTDEDIDIDYQTVENGG